MHEQNSLVYNDPHTLLVIGSTGKIKRLFTPFLVVAKENRTNIAQGESVSVDRIEEESVHLDGLTTRIIMFVIDGVKIQHWYFEIP